VKTEKERMSGSSQPKEKRRPRLLVVDDDRLLSAILQANLEHKGYNIILASSVLAAVQQMRLQRPDLIVLDVVLPGTSGFYWCQRLKADPDTRDIPVLMISGSTVGEQALEAGADAFLPKPIDIRALLAKIRELLKLRSQKQGWSGINASAVKGINVAGRRNP